MITGTVPFDGDTTISVAVQHINDDIPAPSSIVEGVPISIDKIILKCAQKKTERRYQNASELIADLKKSLVMPDEDFVSMEPAYAKAESVQPQELKVEEDDVEDVAKRTVRPVAPKSDDIDRRVEDKIDRELDDISLDDEEREKPRGRRAKDKAKRVREQEEELLEDDDDLDDYDDYDDDDYSNDKLDKAIMYIGIGIVTLIVIVTVAVAVKLFTGGGLSATSDTEGTTASAVKSTTASAEDGKVTVPSLVGKTEDEAKEALNALSLGYKAVKQASSTIPEGKIISQGTTAGTKVNKNTTITLSISSGPDTVEVPNVVGIDQVEAANAIESAGFTVNVKKSYSDTIEAGKVISQSPSGASTANPGTSVTITVSEGKEEAKSATVPNVVGLSEEDAVAKLKELGIESTVSYQTSANNVKDGYVFGQSVKAGEKVTVGSTITISVKKASATTSSSTKATTKAAETATTTKSANN
jgi:serine/threonine-protein kinase